MNIFLKLLNKNNIFYLENYSLLDSDIVNNIKLYITFIEEFNSENNNNIHFLNFLLNFYTYIFNLYSKDLENETKYNKIIKLQLKEFIDYTKILIYKDKIPQANIININWNVIDKLIHKIHINHNLAHNISFAKSNINSLYILHSYCQNIQNNIYKFITNDDINNNFLIILDHFIYKLIDKNPFTQIININIIY